MHATLDGDHAMALVVGLNTDWLFSAGILAAGLLAGAFFGPILLGQ